MGLAAYLRATRSQKVAEFVILGLLSPRVSHRPRPNGIVDFRACVMHFRMNWQAVNFDWNQVRAFLATLDEGSLSAAARALKLTQPTLGRQVAALESHLNVTLFERAGRQLIPTPAALELAEHVRAMGAAATRLSLVAAGQSQTLEGEIKISATEMYSAYVLPGFLAALGTTYPGIRVEVLGTNSLSDLRQREADIAVRNADPKEPDLIARRIRMDTGGFFASKSFLEAHGPIQKLTDLADLPFIGFGNPSEYLDALHGKGVPVTLSNFRAASGNHLVHWELVRSGLGLGVNSWDVGGLFPEVRPVLKNALEFEFPIWLVAPQELRTSRRVRVVYDALADYLKAFSVNPKSSAQVANSA